MGAVTKNQARARIVASRTAARDRFGLLCRSARASTASGRTHRETPGGSGGDPPGVCAVVTTRMPRDPSPSSIRHWVRIEAECQPRWNRGQVGRMTYGAGAGVSGGRHTYRRAPSSAHWTERTYRPPSVSISEGWSSRFARSPARGPPTNSIAVDRGCGSSRKRIMWASLFLHGTPVRLASGCVSSQTEPRSGMDIAHRWWFDLDDVVGGTARRFAP